jgi:O-antigen/teichoic acid export membrane protein
MVTQSLTRADYSGSLVLCVLALVNYALFYVINITLARNLSVKDFDDFSAALSAITILSTVATLGLDKYALRCIPVYRERADWQRTLGFWMFALRTIVLVSLLLAFIGGCWAWVLRPVLPSLSSSSSCSCPSSLPPCFWSRW